LPSSALKNPFDLEPKEYGTQVAERKFFLFLDDNSFGIEPKIRKIGFKKNFPQNY